MINFRYILAFCLLSFSTVLYCQTSPFLVLDWRNADKHILESGQLSFSSPQSSKPYFDLEKFKSNEISTTSYLDQIKKAFTELPNGKQNVILFINGYSCQRKSSIIANGEMLNANFIEHLGSDIGLFTSFNWNAGLSYRKALPLTVEIGYYYADILIQVYNELKAINPDVNLYLITHSMGNRVFTGLYKRFVEQKQTNIFAHHIMSAADIEPTIFSNGEELEHIDEISSSITIYTHALDRVLSVTTDIGKQDRLGLISLTEEQLDEISPHISVVDCSETNDLKALNLGRHNYCKKSNIVTEDIYYTLTGQTKKALKKRVHTKHPRKFYLKSEK